MRGRSILHPEDRDVVLSRLLDNLRHREIFQMDFRMCSRMVNGYGSQAMGKPFDIDENNVPHRAIGTCIDITDQKTCRATDV